MVGLPEQQFTFQSQQIRVPKPFSAGDGELIRVRARIEDRFERKGHEFVVLDVVMLGEDRVIEEVRHTAIWRPRKSIKREAPEAIAPVPRSCSRSEPNSRGTT